MTMRKTILGLAVLAGAMAFGTAQADTEQLAFPGAEGFGRYATGGRGGVVYYVTSLDDCPDSDLKEGTLRWALHTNNSDPTPRTILFKVGGTIHLTSDLKTNCSNVSILGQSAPGGGICIADCKLYVNKSNVIIRYVRFRAGDVRRASFTSCDVENCKQVIIDHCSFSWSMEENITMYDNDSTTLQWCILSEPLYDSYNPKGVRGYGAQWGGEYSTFHHNVFVHCPQRIPQVNGVNSNAANPESHDFHVNEEIVNNVIYNGFGSEATYNGRLDAPNVADAYCRVNLMNNYYKPGPITYGKEKSAKNRFFCTIYNTLNEYLSPNNKPENLAWFVDGNKYEQNEYTVMDVTNINNNNWYNVNTSTGGIKFKGALVGTVDTHKLTERSVNSGVEMQSAEEAFALVVKNAGAQWPSMDEVDARVLAEAAGLQEPKFVGSTLPAYTGLINSQDDLKPADADDTWSAWPDLTAFPDETVPADTDGDGMPDAWEDANSLDKNNAADGAAIAANGYSNLENYLNSIVEGVKAPSNLVAKRSSEGTDVIISWADNSDSEIGFRLDRADITAGTDTTFVTVAEKAADVTEYTDATAESGSKYIYRLRAVTSTGTTNAVRTVLYAKNDGSRVTESRGVDGLTVAPNPVKNVVNVVSGEALKTIAVVDMDGRAVLSVNAAGKNVLNINAAALSNGMYIVKVIAESGNMSAVKIIKE